jgi:diacylglycerol O-acyltransferase / wax synthase
VERLRGLDTAFLYLETPTNHLHVMWAAVLDTRDTPEAASCRGLSELIASRLHLLPALRKRLAGPRLGYTQPDWIDVDVDPADHCTLHEADDVEAVAADVLSRPLDRNRPLWETHVVEGLPDGRTGLIMKLHHALLDGPSGAELMVQLLDLERHPSTGPAPPPMIVEPPPSRAELVRVARRRATRGAPRAVAEMRRAAEVLAATRRWDTEHSAAGLPRPFTAPRTPFNQSITARRAVRFTGVPLDALDKIRRHTGSTVNDVVLAVTGGALRRYLLRRGALPTAPLLAMVPVSTRDAGSATGGNHVSGFVTTLATDVGDPVERLSEVTRVTNAVKLRHDDTGLGSLMGLQDLVPPRAGQGLARLAGRVQLARWGPRSYNVVVSNVPGPDAPFYCNGALVESAHPMGPITDWSAINVTVVSYRRYLGFGLVSCPDVVPDIDELRDDFDAEIDALRRS